LSLFIAVFIDLSLYVVVLFKVSALDLYFSSLTAYFAAFTLFFCFADLIAYLADLIAYLADLDAYLYDSLKSSLACCFSNFLYNLAAFIS